MRCELDRWTGDIQNLSFILWSPPIDKMTAEETERYNKDVEFIQAENKKFRLQIAYKVTGLVVVPFLVWLIIAMSDFGKKVSSLGDNILVLIQIPLMLLYLFSLLAFPRYGVLMLAILLIWITVMLVVSNEKTESTRSPNDWSAAPTPKDPLHVRFTPFIVFVAIILGFAGSYCRMTYPDSTYPYKKL